MGLASWMRGLFESPTRSRPARGARPTPAAGSTRRHDEPPAALPRSRAGTESQPDLDYVPRPSRVGNLDSTGPMTVVLEGPEEELLWRLSRRIDAGDYKVPQLPATTLAALELSGRPSAEVAAVVELITSDPLLSSELLRMANSALYAGAVPAETLHQAVMRVGLRALRGLIFSVSLRGVLLKDRILSEYAEEVWRQSLSVAGVARGIARPLGFEPEQAYLLGLLHDVGKVALLALLREEGKRGHDLTTALVGQVFHSLHEKAGAAMAQAWKLPETVASVAGCHHDLDANREHPREAALAQLAHQLDLYDSLDDDEGFTSLVRHAAFDVLGASEDVRRTVLQGARRALQRADEARAARA